MGNAQLQASDAQPNHDTTLANGGDSHGGCQLLALAIEERVRLELEARRPDLEQARAGIKASEAEARRIVDEDRAVLERQLSSAVFVNFPVVFLPIEPVLAMLPRAANNTCNDDPSLIEPV